MFSVLFNTNKNFAKVNKEVHKGNWICYTGMKMFSLLLFRVRRIEALQKGGFEIDFRAYHKTYTMEMSEIGEISEWIKKRLRS